MGKLGPYLSYTLWTETWPRAGLSLGMAELKLENGFSDCLVRFILSKLLLMLYRLNEFVRSGLGN